MSTQSAIASSINSVVNQSDISGIPSRIINAIKNAAAKTGVDFSYLLKNAIQESGLNSSAHAASSSASGLFQFTSQTWLQMVKTYGGQYGLGDYASQISSDASGHLSVSDPTARKAILAMRNDPQVSAEMAGELNKQNAGILADNVGGKIGGTELYLAHFLGASGASDFLSELKDNPKVAAASVLPQAASANPSVFYTKSGQPRSLQQIYDHFAQKFGSGDIQTASATASTTTGSNYNIAAAATGVSSLTASMASIMSAGSSSNSPSGSLGAYHLASAGGSGGLSGSATLFNTMILGQMGGSSSDKISPFSAMDIHGKKNSGHAGLSAIG